MEIVFVIGILMAFMLGAFVRKALFFCKERSGETGNPRADRRGEKGAVVGAGATGQHDERGESGI